MIATNRIQLAKAVAIIDYLAYKGFQPVSQHGKRLVYSSPFRLENTPSFWVNTSINRYKDFGSSEAGDDIIKLVQHLNGFSFTQAVEELIQFAGLEVKPAFSFSGPIRSQPTEAVIRSIKLLSNAQLIRYVESRKISYPVARRYCHEIYFQQGGKNQFALGFINQKGGYALRNGIGAKRNLGPAGYSLIDAPGVDCINVFEGVFDFLSGLEFYGRQTPHFPTLVLNSTTNLESAIPIIEKFERTNAYLDNDKAGRAALDKLQNIGNKVVDRAGLYQTHKDFNAFWLEISKSHVSQ